MCTMRRKSDLQRKTNSLSTSEIFLPKHRAFLPPLQSSYLEGQGASWLTHRADWCWHSPAVSHSRWHCWGCARRGLPEDRWPSSPRRRSPAAACSSGQWPPQQWTSAWVRHLASFLDWKTRRESRNDKCLYRLRTGRAHKSHLQDPVGDIYAKTDSPKSN